jgi:hypothetical protein
MALKAVRDGAGECLIRITYAPGVEEPIDVVVDSLQSA